MFTPRDPKSSEQPKETKTEAEVKQAIFHLPSSSQTTTPHKSARKDQLTSEEKVAAGIKSLYNLYVKELNELDEKDHEEKGMEKYDAQGIATIFVTKERLIDKKLPKEKIDALLEKFPDHLEKGIMIHVYKPGFIKAPPIQYMIRLQIHAFCEAAKHPPFSLVIDEDAIIKNLMIESRMKEIVESGGDFTAKTKILMHDMLVNTLAVLHREYKKNTPSPMTIIDFSKALSHTVENYRPSFSMLTFNCETQQFSYDSGASITAHDRTAGLAGDRCPNLSLVYEGRFTDKRYRPFEVSTSFVKHASLAPIDSMITGVISLVHSTHNKILVDTYKNAKEVIELIVKMRVHGGAPTNQEMEIDWNYLLLTTNFGNDEQQAKTYSYIVTTMHLLNNARIQVALDDGTTVSVKVTASVFNAGINKLAAMHVGWGSSTQDAENRTAYMHATDVFAREKPFYPIDAQAVDKEMLDKLKMVCPPELDSHVSKEKFDPRISIADLKIKRTILNVKFSHRSKLPKIDALLQQFKQPGQTDDKVYIDFSQIVKLYDDWKKIEKTSLNKAEVDNATAQLKIVKLLIGKFEGHVNAQYQDIHKLTYTEEAQRNKHWKKNRKNIMKAIEYLKQSQLLTQLQSNLDYESLEPYQIADHFPKMPTYFKYESTSEEKKIESDVTEILSTEKTNWIAMFKKEFTGALENEKDILAAFKLRQFFCKGDEKETYRFADYNELSSVLANLNKKKDADGNFTSTVNGQVYRLHVPKRLYNLLEEVGFNQRDLAAKLTLVDVLKYDAAIFYAEGQLDQSIKQTYKEAKDLAAIELAKESSITKQAAADKEFKNEKMFVDDETSFRHDLRQSVKPYIAGIYNDRKEKAEEQLLHIIAYVYKAYLDDLYYTEIEDLKQYIDPQAAALFNTYFAAFQHIMGMLSSTGCKSANDRTYVIRLFIAAMEDRDLLKEPIPLNYYNNPEHYIKFIQLMIPKMMTDTALQSCLVDTSGGTPKFNPGKFPYLKVKNIPQFDFEEFAAHKLDFNNIFKDINIEEVLQKLDASAKEMQDQEKALEKVKPTTETTRARLAAAHVANSLFPTIAPMTPTKGAEAKVSSPVLVDTSSRTELRRKAT